MTAPPQAAPEPPERLHGPGVTHATAPVGEGALREAGGGSPTGRGTGREETTRPPHAGHRTTLTRDLPTRDIGLL
jgi:hypothetical protein